MQRMDVYMCLCMFVCYHVHFLWSPSGTQMVKPTQHSAGGRGRGTHTGHRLQMAQRASPSRLHGTTRGGDLCVCVSLCVRLGKTVPWLQTVSPLQKKKKFLYQVIGLWVCSAYSVLSLLVLLFILYLSPMSLPLIVGSVSDAMQSLIFNNN